MIAAAILIAGIAALAFIRWWRAGPPTQGEGWWE